MSKILEKEEKDNTLVTSSTEHTISIGYMTYIVVSHFDETAEDTAIDKIERLIKRDVSAS